MVTFVHLTFVGPLSGMDDFMRLKVCLVSKNLKTKSTFQATLTSLLACLLSGVEDVCDSILFGTFLSVGTFIPFFV